MLSKIERSAPLTLLFFLLFAIIIRFFSFFPSIINHDESTYIVIADALLNGQTYFVDVIDTKPVGIFLVYAGIQQVVGSSIFMLRLVATLFLGFTAFFLYLATKKAGGNARSGIAAGTIYLIMNSIFTYYGIAPNTETFFAFFTALALYLWVKEERTWIYPLVGLSMGVGFIIKYVVAFDALAFGLFMLWLAYRKERPWGKTILQSALMLFGFLIPFGVSIAYYSNLGYLDEFFFYTLEVSSRYPDAAGAWDYVKFFLDFNLRVLLVVVMAILVIRSGKVSSRIAQFGMLWMLLVWIVVLLPGKFFAHYCIQVMLPLSYVAGSFFQLDRESIPKWLRVLTSIKVGGIILIILLLINTIFHKIDYFDKKDHPREIAAFLQEELKEGETFFIGNYEQILYHLLQQPSPVPYVHSSLLWSPNHQEALMINEDEVLSQLKNVSPRFIFRKRSSWEENMSMIEDWLVEGYQIRKTFNDEIDVYERK